MKSQKIMKNSLIIMLLITAFAFLTQSASGQIKLNLKKKVNREADRRANQNTQKAVNSGFDKMEEGIKDIFKKNDNEENDNGERADSVTPGVAVTPADANVNNQQTVSQENQNTSPVLTWNKYDFVPGDKIIFEDNLVGEENGEFPSRWDLRSGNTEIAEFGGENVIMFRDGTPEIIPYMKEAGKDYLPEVFTVEFDLYCGSDKFEVFLFDRKNQKSGSPTGYTKFNITYNQMEFGQSRSTYPEAKSLQERRWIHVSIAYTNGKLKAYMDETRLINLPRIDFDPKGISLYIYHARIDNLYYVKNFRIAQGGVKYYDRFLQDGKIIANGIRFDINKATIKPESMGVINEIYNMLNDHPEVSVSIEGHTDSDGDSDLNQKLSEDRAKTVMDQLVSMGIDAGKVSFKGFGETKPIDTNDTSEGKASNRRVEFVKM